MFNLLRQHNLHLKLKKCNFSTHQLEFLGHIISASGVVTDPAKVQIVQDWPTSTCVKDVRSFLGMAGYILQNKDIVILSCYTFINVLQ